MTTTTASTQSCYTPGGFANARSVELQNALPAGSLGRVTMSTPTGVTSYSYDTAGRLATLVDPLLGTYGFTTNTDGLRTSLTRPNGVDTSYDYDALLRLATVTQTGPSGLIDSYDYSYDPDANRTSVTSAAGVESYTIDAVNRLTDVTYPDGVEVSYSYDAAGNRLSETVDGTATAYTYDTTGRLTTIGSDAVTYDAAGNTTGIGLDTYGFDWANRLTSATVNGVTGTYAYDGDGTPSKGSEDDGESPETE